MHAAEQDTADPTATVLLVEDDPDIARTLRGPLAEWGYRLAWVTTAADARAYLAEVEPDLIILDLVLPDADGLLVTASLQAATRAPILICSGRNRQVDRVLGLKLGASDFVAKPFDLDELEARIGALTRRASSLRPADDTRSLAEICVGELKITPRRASVTITDRPVHLTPTEYRLLTILASEPESIFDRQSLSRSVWGFDDPSGKHLVDVHIGRLRAKLRAVSTSVPLVVTVRGRGFCLVAGAHHAQNRPT